MGTQDLERDSGNEWTRLGLPDTTHKYLFDRPGFGRPMEQAVHNYLIHFQARERVRVPVCCKFEMEEDAAQALGPEFAHHVGSIREPLKN